MNVTTPTQGVIDGVTSPDANGTPKAAAEEAQQFELSIDLDVLKIGDIGRLNFEETGGQRMKGILDLLDQVVEGGVRKLPVRWIRPIGQALTEEIQALTQLDGENLEAAAKAPLPEGVSVDTDRLLIEDLELLDGEDRSLETMLVLLGKVVVGAKVEELPIRYLALISARLQVAMRGLSDLGN